MSMKINSILPIYKSITFRSRERTDANTTPLSPLTSDVLEIRKNSSKINGDEILNRFDKIDINSYKTLSTEEIEAVRESCGYDVRMAASYSVDMGIELEKYFSDMFGKDDWTYVSIGNSPAGIGRVLQFMGIETRFLPISNLKNVPSFTDLSEYDDKFPQYGEFLKEQGLTQEKINETGKTYLFTDYVYTGRSIKTFKKMMMDKFGITSPKVLYPTLNAHLEKAISDEDSALGYYRREYIRKYLRDARIEQYVGIPHIKIEELDKINELKNCITENGKRFNFMVIYNLDKKGILKDNPSNQVCI